MPMLFPDNSQLHVLLLLNSHSNLLLPFDSPKKQIRQYPRSFMHGCLQLLPPTHSNGKHTLFADTNSSGPSYMSLMESSIYRRYTPAPMMEQVTIPVLPGSLRREVIYRNHDAPTAGHQGFERTLSRLKTGGLLGKHDQ